MQYNTITYIIVILLILFVMFIAWMVPLFIQQGVLQKKKKPSIWPSIYLSIVIGICGFIMLFLSNKPFNHKKLNPQHRIEHSSVYNVGYNKLVSSIPSEKGLVVKSHRIEYDKEYDAFKITFDFVALNHSGFMQNDSKTFQVKPNELN